MEGTELLSKLRKTEPEMIKIIITGYATLDNSIEATNKGVDGYIVKPFDSRKLTSLIESKLKEQRKKIQFDEKKVAEYIELRHSWMANVNLKK
jgi:DNA-binding NtrC family response regulator